jgi:type IV pilus assembly protein PilB
MISNLSQYELTDLFVAEGFIDREKMNQLINLARDQRSTVFHVILEKDIVRDEKVIQFLSEKMEIPILNLSSYKIQKEILALIPTKLVDRHGLLAISKIKKLLTIVTSDPFDLLARDEVKGVTQCDVSMVLSTPKQINSMIEHYYSKSNNLDEIIEGIDEDSLEVVKTEDDSDSTGSVGAVEDAPVVRMVNVILDGALKSRASDIHFEPYEKAFRVRYRIDGGLRESFSHSRDIYASLVARVKIISNLDITERRIPQDGRFRIRTSTKEVDFRVSILPTYYGEKIVLRVLDKAGLKSGLDQLGFTEIPTAKFAEAIKSPYGMILVTGPTGSGKSTSLYTILGTMNTPNRNIMTVEDPVEYQVEGITQTQVLPEVGLTFAAGLRSLLRQSPDIVLVGEIRDGETADIAVKAALTGHLVFSTLHTNSAAGSITRLIDMGVEPFLIASSLISSAAQRLMKRICPHCKEEIKLDAEIIRRCGMSAGKLNQIKAFKGRGCAKCNDSGYLGRIPAVEVMVMDNDLRELVIKRESSNMIHKVAVEKGMETLFENAFSLFESGKTTLEEVLRVTSAG